MNKFATVSVGLSSIIFVVLIPILELNSTHLTNPDWPSHARLHEAWQLLTNAAISVLAMACILTSRAPRIGISLSLIICVSFLTAWVFGPTYGGSMLHSDGTQLAVAGINLAVIIVSILTILLVFSLWRMRAHSVLTEQRNKSIP